MKKRLSLLLCLMMAVISSCDKISADWHNRGKDDPTPPPVTPEVPDDTLAFTSDSLSVFGNGEGFVVLLPQEETSTFEDGVLTFTFPQLQEENTVSPCIGEAFEVDSAVYEIRLQPIYATVKVPVLGNKHILSAVEVSGLNGEVIGGRCSVSDFDFPFPAMHSRDGSTVIRKQLAEDVTLNMEEPCVVSVDIPVISYLKGIRVAAIDYKGRELVAAECPGTGTLSSPIVPGEVIISDTLTCTEYMLEWSTGALIEENGVWRFSDTDSPNPTEPYGQIFQYEATKGVSIAMDTPTPGSELNGTGWYDYGAISGIDPCSRVLVDLGENPWRVPTEAEMKEWVMISYNNPITLEGYTYPTVYAEFAAGPQIIKVFPSGYTPSKGTLKSSDWAGFWVKAEEDYVDTKKTKFVLYKPSYKLVDGTNPDWKTWNSSSYVIVASGGKYRTPGVQYRCCRDK